MQKIKSFSEFNVNEELMDMMFYPGDDYVKDISKVYSEIWDSIVKFWDRIKEKAIGLFNNVREFISKLWEMICEISKDKWNKLCNFLFQKNYSEVSLSDVNFSNAKRLGTDLANSMKEFFTDKTWSFKDDAEKIKSDPEAAIEDKSIRLKTAINKALTTSFKFVGLPIFTTTLVSTLTPILVSIVSGLGLVVTSASVGMICGIVLSALIMILVVFLRKKQIKFEIKLFQDVSDIPGFEDETIVQRLRRVSGFEEFAKKKEIDLQEFTTGKDTEFQRKFRARLDELKSDIANQIIKQEVIFV